jgi:hypothetical protein
MCTILIFITKRFVLADLWLQVLILGEAVTIIMNAMLIVFAKTGSAVSVYRPFL